MKKLRLKQLGKKKFPIYKINLSIKSTSQSSYKNYNYGLYLPKQEIIAFAWKRILQNIKIGYIPTKSLIRISLKILKNNLNNIK